MIAAIPLRASGGVMIEVLLSSLIAYSPAQNTPMCGVLQGLEEGLEAQYGETPLIEWDVTTAEGAPPAILRLYVNPKTGTVTALTLIERGPVTLGCLSGDGKGFRAAPRKEKGQGT